MVNYYWTKGAEAENSKNSLFNKWCWEIWNSTFKKMKLDHQLILYTRINSKWIEYLNISHNTIKILEENIGSIILDIQCSNIFTSMPPKARDIRKKINKWDLIKIKSLCIATENSKMKRETTVWENIFANFASGKGLFSKIYKELM